MAKVLGIGKNGTPTLVEIDDDRKGSMLHLVDLIHDGIDDMYDWERQGDDYHDYVVDSFTHALSGIQLLGDALAEKAKSCPKMKEAFDAFINEMKK